VRSYKTVSKLNSAVPVRFSTSGYGDLNFMAAALAVLNSVTIWTIGSHNLSHQRPHKMRHPAIKKVYPLLLPTNPTPTRAKSNSKWLLSSAFADTNVQQPRTAQHDTPVLLTSSFKQLQLSLHQVGHAGAYLQSNTAYRCNPSFASFVL
jgi:hypothetical protein